MSDDSPPDPAEYVAHWAGENWQDRFERDRGILTDTDRKHLWGISDYGSPQSLSERRGYIRDRFAHGLRDLYYLSMLDERQRESILEKVREEGETGELRSAVASLVEFLYLGLDGDEEWLEQTVVHGISNALYELEESGRYGHPTVDAEIEVSRGHNLDELAERLEEGMAHTLTAEEIGVLVREGRVDPEELEQLGPSEPDPENPLFDVPAVGGDDES